jgi:hypothetical protein
MNNILVISAIDVIYDVNIQLVNISIQFEIKFCVFMYFAYCIYVCSTPNVIR